MSATGNLDARIPPPQPSFVLVRPPRAARELSWGITTDASLASLSGIPAVIEFAARERSRRARSGASISSNIVADEEVVVVHDRRDTAEALAAPVAAAVDADNDAEYSHGEWGSGRGGARAANVLITHHQRPQLQSSTRGQQRCGLLSLRTRCAAYARAAWHACSSV